MRRTIVAIVLIAVFGGMASGQSLTPPAQQRLDEVIPTIRLRNGIYIALGVIALAGTVVVSVDATQNAENPDYEEGPLFWGGAAAVWTGVYGAGINWLVFLRPSRQYRQAQADIAHQREMRRIQEAQARVREIELRNQERRLEEMTDKWGEEVAKRIVAHQIWIGMTEPMIVDSIGEPDDINRSVSEHGIRSQYVYRDLDLYAYFEDGQMTSWQD